MDQPLAERLRPQNLDEFLGQNKILGEQSLLRKSLENDSVPSMIFWGPPGCGKTSLAHVIRQHTKKAFVALSAVASGVKEVKEVLADARKMKGMFKDTILFIDEIHRFNKGQQDALLGAVEDGTVTLIGATTENPGFEVNSALLSRCQLILFAPLSKEDLRTLIFSALRDHPRGLQLKDVEVEDAVVEKLIAQSDGDARFLLNQIEWIGKNLGDRKVIDEKLLEEFQYKKPLRYDKSGEEHYNLISALHKSVRGSDPDAALYWLHRMLQGGEDPRFILRRLMRMSMEDIGLADPNALLLATAAREAYDFMGIPEGLIALGKIDQLIDDGARQRIAGNGTLLGRSGRFGRGCLGAFFILLAAGTSEGVAGFGGFFRGGGLSRGRISGGLRDRSVSIGSLSGRRFSSRGLCRRRLRLGGFRFGLGLRSFIDQHGTDLGRFFILFGEAGTAAQQSCQQNRG